MKALWITGWYPNQTEPFAGDFVQRHAQAVSLFCDVSVLFVVRDVKRRFDRSVYIEEFSSSSLKEKLVYYSLPPYLPSGLQKWVSYLQYIRLVKQHVLKYISENGKPDVIHLYIGMKLGKIAEWIKNELHIPFVVSEQWTGFLTEAKPSFNELPAYFQTHWKKMARQACGVSAVSMYLGNALQCLVKEDITVTVIPNVVNTAIFFPASVSDKNSTPVFVHICGDYYQKDSENIIKAFAIIKEKGLPFQLDIFGPSSGSLESIASQFNVPVNFYNEVSQEQLASYMRKSDALILYSRYETFGCVLIEANATGLPVIASNIPVVRETIADAVNGMLVEKEKPAALAEKIEIFINRQIEFDTKGIATATAKRYNYETVGKAFFEFYKRSLQHTM